VIAVRQPHDGRLVEFGPFALDPDSLELWRGEVRQSIGPLPARLLLHLARRGGTLAGRQELLSLGCPDPSGVTDQSLNTCIHEIRLALNRSGPQPVRLETLRGRGYRLVVDKDASEARTPGRRHAVLASLAGLAAVAAVVLFAVATRAPLVPSAARQALDRARYLAEETQDLSAAQVVLDSARRAFPDVAAVHAEFAEVSLLLGKTDEAQQAVGDALRLDADQVTAHRTRGTLALLAGNWSSADSALALAYRLDSSDTRTLAALAFRYAIEGRFAETDRYIRQAIAIDPLSAVLYRDAGFLYLIAGRYDDAERYCREMLRFQPGSVWATDCLFDVAVLSGHTAAAAEWGRRLLRAYRAPEPGEHVSAPDAVEATEAWRLDAWIAAVGRGAHPFGLALAYAANGRLDESLDALNAAAVRPSLGLLTIAVDPRLANVRTHRGFTDLLRQLKLPALIPS
jgi:DNA-binding winged helix-turn-helix (wHTH) protein/Flp pilus assembly protein TadD